MNITANTTYNLKVYEGLSRLESFKRKNPKKCMFWISTGCSLLIALFAVMYWFFRDMVTWRNLIAAPLLVLLYVNYMYFLSPIIKYKSADRLADIKNTFTFTDDGVEMVSNSNGYKGQCHFNYDGLYRVYETNDFIFLCQDKTKIFVVDKAEVLDSDEDIIRARLKELIGSRYQRCKY